jgi:hypothetical protein
MDEKGGLDGMAEYQRIVSYLYKYNDGQKGENTGFVRVETRSDGLRLFFHIKDLRMMDERKLKVYFYFHREGKEEAVFVDEFLCSRGNCEYKKTIPEESMAGGPPLRQMAGMIFYDSRGLLYGTCWDEQEILEKRIKLPGAEPEESEEPEKPEEPEKSEEPEKPEKSEEPFTEEMEQSISLTMEEIPMTPMEKMMKEHPKVEFQWDSGFVEAVKIEPKDIGQCSMKDWRYAGNGFLLQGYESHGYLILGKISMDEERPFWVLGVPGIYNNREKYLAQIFGFYDYIPVKQGELKTGGFGFWIASLSDE